jgi:hypothetical protein
LGTKNAETRSYMKRTSLLILITIIVFSIIETVLASSEKVIVTGTSLNQDLRKATAEAKNDAKRKAIEQVSGVRIKSSSLVVNYRLASDFILAETIAEIADYKILEWELENLRKQRDQEPFLQVTVRMEVVVKESDVKPDRNFQIAAKLNKHVFYAGDDVRIEDLQVTKESFMYIVCVNDDTVYPIVPNKYVKELRLKPNEVITFPTKELRTRGLSIVTSTSENKEIDYDQLLVIATKYNNSIFTTFLLNNPSIDIRTFSRELMRISLDERAMQVFDYETRRKQNR